MSDTKPPRTREQNLNYLRRLLTSIEDNAKKAGNKHWGISHSHVIVFDPITKQSYDVAARPYQRKECVYGVFPYASPSSSDDMRHIATCNPDTMANFAKRLRAVFPELARPPTK